MTGRTCLGVLLLLLALAIPAAAEDDDGLLDTKSLGDAMPERLDQLEREWADDTGIRDPLDPPDDPPEDDVEPAPDVAADDADAAPRAAPPALADPPRPAKPKKNALEPSDERGRTSPGSPPPSRGSLMDPED